MEFVDFDKRSLWISAASITFNPLFWNIVARAEYKYRILTRFLGCGNPYTGCYFLAATIFSLGIFRDFLYKAALEEQPSVKFLAGPNVKYAAYGLIALGNVFVLSSTWRLGITGTFLGDYFGILMKERVTGFPFNVLDNPMYVGSTMIFLGTALWYQSVAGLMLTCYVWIVYRIALVFEESFTGMIYSKAAAAKSKRSKLKKI